MQRVRNEERPGPESHVRWTGNDERPEPSVWRPCGTMKGRSLASGDHVAGTWGANYEVAGSKPRQARGKKKQKRKKTGRTATVYFGTASRTSIDANRMQVLQTRKVVRPKIRNKVLEREISCRIFQHRMFYNTSVGCCSDEPNTRLRYLRSRQRKQIALRISGSHVLLLEIEVKGE